MEYTASLKEKLTKNGFTEEQYGLIHASISETQNEWTQASTAQQKQVQDKNVERLFALAEKVVENPKNVLTLFRANWLAYVSDLVIALAILTTLILLSWRGILGTCEASTIFGGIVGYLLGKGSN